MLTRSVGRVSRPVDLLTRSSVALSRRHYKVSDRHIRQAPASSVQLGSAADGSLVLWGAPRALMPGCVATLLAQGGLTDKDRIFTNLYNDQSPYLEAAKKRVRCRRHCCPAAASALLLSNNWRPYVVVVDFLAPRRATGTRPRSSCSSGRSRSSPT